MENSYDIAIIGGGIIGLATARALGERAPRARLVILEKEAKLATHQTGNNSGILVSITSPALTRRSSASRARA